MTRFQREDDDLPQRDTELEDAEPRDRSPSPQGGEITDEVRIPAPPPVPPRVVAPPVPPQQHMAPPPPGAQPTGAQPPQPQLSPADRALYARIANTIANFDDRTKYVLHTIRQLRQLDVDTIRQATQGTAYAMSTPVLRRIVKTIRKAFEDGGGKQTTFLQHLGTAIFQSHGGLSAWQTAPLGAGIVNAFNAKQAGSEAGGPQPDDGEFARKSQTIAAMDGRRQVVLYCLRTNFGWNDNSASIATNSQHTQYPMTQNEVKDLYREFSDALHRDTGRKSRSLEELGRIVRGASGPASAWNLTPLHLVTGLDADGKPANRAQQPPEPPPRAAQQPQAQPQPGLGPQGPPGPPRPQAWPRTPVQAPGQPPQATYQQAQLQQMQAWNRFSQQAHAWDQQWNAWAQQAQGRPGPGAGALRLPGPPPRALSQALALQQAQAWPQPQAAQVVQAWQQARAWERQSHAALQGAATQLQQQHIDDERRERDKVATATAQALVASFDPSTMAIVDLVRRNGWTVEKVAVELEMRKTPMDREELGRTIGVIGANIAKALDFRLPRDIPDVQQMAQFLFERVRWQPQPVGPAAPADESAMQQPAPTSPPPAPELTGQSLLYSKLPTQFRVALEFARRDGATLQSVTEGLRARGEAPGNIVSLGLLLKIARYVSLAFKLPAPTNLDEIKQLAASVYSEVPWGPDLRPLPPPEPTIKTEEIPQTLEQPAAPQAQPLTQTPAQPQATSAADPVQASLNYLGNLSREDRLVLQGLRDGLSVDAIADESQTKPRVHRLITADVKSRIESMRETLSAILGREIKTQNLSGVIRAAADPAVGPWLHYELAPQKSPGPPEERGTPSPPPGNQSPSDLYRESPPPPRRGRSLSPGRRKAEALDRVAQAIDSLTVHEQYVLAAARAKYPATKLLDEGNRFHRLDLDVGTVAKLSKEIITKISRKARTAIPGSTYPDLLTAVNAPASRGGPLAPLLRQPLPKWSVLANHVIKK